MKELCEIEEIKEEAKLSNPEWALDPVFKMIKRAHNFVSRKQFEKARRTYTQAYYRSLDKGWNNLALPLLAIISRYDVKLHAYETGLMNFNSYLKLAKKSGNAEREHRALVYRNRLYLEWIDYSRHRLKTEEDKRNFKSLVADGFRSLSEAFMFIYIAHDSSQSFMHSAAHLVEDIRRDTYVAFGKSGKRRDLWLYKKCDRPKCRGPYANKK